MHCRVIGYNFTLAPSAVAEWLDCVWSQKFVNELALNSVQTIQHEQTML